MSKGVKVQLLVQPSEAETGQPQFVQVTMAVHCWPLYPDVPPTITLTRPKGISEYVQYTFSLQTRRILLPGPRTTSTVRYPAGIHSNREDPDGAPCHALRNGAVWSNHHQCFFETETRCRAVMGAVMGAGGLLQEGRSTLGVSSSRSSSQGCITFQKIC